jgi:CRISPR/Cas system endoribonuclease Cas6 (RAMP superfamily)
MQRPNLKRKKTDSKRGERVASLTLWWGRANYNDRKKEKPVTESTWKFGFLCSQIKKNLVIYVFSKGKNNLHFVTVIHIWKIHDWERGGCHSWRCANVHVHCAACLKTI